MERSSAFCKCGSVKGLGCFDFSELADELGGITISIGVIEGVLHEDGGHGSVAIRP